MPTFQQTFANCPFPEGVLAVLGDYPVQVRVLKTQRAMEVIATGTNVSRETLAQAEECLKRAFSLSAATVKVDEPQPAVPERSEPATEENVSTPKGPAREKKPVLSPEAGKSVAPPKPTVPKKGPDQGLEEQMEAMRRKLLHPSSNASASGGGKKRVKQIYGKISGKKKPIPLGELALDMGSVLV
ncbi:MAG: hypothetical protein K2M15_05895, partial [Oscillospiraceae bacterium]|nr:hypothetical protein [Oscillospiraceae bacterium]